MVTRRDLLVTGAALGGALVATARSARAAQGDASGRGPGDRGLVHHGPLA